MEKTGASLKEHQQALSELLEEFDRVCEKLDIKYTLFSGTLLGAVRHNGFIPWDDDLDVMMLREDYEKLLENADTVLDTEKFFLQKEFSEHFPMFFSKLRINGTTCLEKYHPKDTEAHMGVYMDIFPCDNAAESKLGRKMQFFASKIVIAKALFKRGYITNSINKKIFMSVCRILPSAPFRRIVQGKCSKKSGMVHSFFAAASDYEKNLYPRFWFTELEKAEFEGKLFSASRHYDEILSKIYGDYMTLPPEEDRKCKVHAVYVDLEKSYEEYKDIHKNMVFDTLSESIR